MHLHSVSLFFLFFFYLFHDVGMCVFVCAYASVFLFAL